MATFDNPDKDYTISAATRRMRSQALLTSISTRQQATTSSSALDPATWFLVRGQITLSLAANSRGGAYATAMAPLKAPPGLDFPRPSTGGNYAACASQLQAAQLSTGVSF